jgi:hypothetical protein
VRLAADQNVKEEFCNTARGAMIATSIGGSITGKGGDRIVIDDPHQPTQIDSDLQREAVHEYFRRTLSTRLDDKQHGAIVLVMQRLHERDLSACCRELEYVLVCLPVEAETRTEIRFPRSGRLQIRDVGDLLWPTRDGRVTDPPGPHGLCSAVSAAAGAGRRETVQAGMVRGRVRRCRAGRCAPGARVGHRRDRRRRRLDLWR